MNVKVDLTGCGVKLEELEKYKDAIERATDDLWSDEDPRYGWVKLPMRMNAGDLARMFNAAERTAEKCGMFVIVGNGGSYLGIKAVIEAVGDRPEGAPKVMFVGEGISSREFSDTLDRMDHYEVCVCVISKYGETPETIAAYQIVKDYMFDRYGDKEAAERIRILTGAPESTLGQMAAKDGCQSFEISKDYSGNYGILSTASLFPMAVAGVEIDKLLSGAEVMATDDEWDTTAGYYAAARKILNDRGKIVEVFQYGQPDLDSLATWVSHLFMESDSKKGKGIYTSTMNLARDFKAKAQYMSSAAPAFFETEILAAETGSDLELPKDIKDRTKADTVDELGRIIAEQMKETYRSDDMDAIKIEIPNTDAYNLGQIIYFFLMSASISAHLFGVDPFERSMIDRFKERLKLK